MESRYEAMLFELQVEADSEADYLSELAAEHRDPYACCGYEDYEEEVAA